MLRARWFLVPAAALLSAAWAAPPSAHEKARAVASEIRDGRAHEAVFDRIKGSVVTVEVLPLAGEAKSSLGSGYVVGPGLVVTNYHVVGAFVQHPERYELRVKGSDGLLPAVLRAFDLTNDLALLEAKLGAAPLALAEGPGRPGAPVIAFGNPEGLGLSLIEGVFNGFAERGFVDRMLLSMPLNAGMSGGPILDADHRVVGTNVSVYWRANSLSFGVPVTAVHELLRAKALAPGRAALAAEQAAQEAALERRARARAIDPLLAGTPVLAVGGALAPRLPEVYECWNQTDLQAHETVRKTTYSCNLQFTPSVEDVGELASFEVLVEHFQTQAGRFGFYGGLSAHAPQHFSVNAQPPGNGDFSPPQCRSDRVRTGELAWKVSTCAYAYVRHPGLGYFALAATSLSRPGEAAYVALHGRGVGVESFLALSRVMLERVKLGGAQP
jgi:S1-C subfamily serine protease